MIPIRIIYAMPLFNLAELIGVWKQTKCGITIYLYEDGMSVPEEFAIINFKGGLYAVTTDIDQKTDMDTMNAEIDAFLMENGFERDKTRPDLGNVITSPRVKETMGYEQMNYWTPIKEK